MEKKDEIHFTDYVEPKLATISDLLVTFAKDAKLLKVIVEKFEKHQAYKVEFALSLPNKNLIASETSHSVHKAVDIAKDRLVLQIKKHLDHLRKEREHQSIRDAIDTNVVVEKFDFEQDAVA